MSVKWEAMRTLIHRPGQFVGYITQEPDRHNRVYAKIWKNMPYTEPDNEISGMDGFYPVDQIEPYVTVSYDPVFTRWGLPPGYVQSHDLTADERIKLENFVRNGAMVITNGNGLLPEEGDQVDEIGADLIEFVQDLLRKAMAR